MGAYWPGAWKAATVLIALIVIRMVEIIPQLAVLRPGLIGSFAVFTLVLLKTRPSVWETIFRERSTRLVFAYLGVIVVTIPLGYWIGGSFPILRQLPYFAFVYLAIQACAPTRQTLDRIVYWSALLGAGYAAIVAALGRVKEDVVGGARLSGTGTYDPNDLALLFVSMGLMATGVALRARGLTRLLAGGSVGVLMTVMLTTGSRGGIVAICVGAVVLLFGQNVKRGAVLVVVLAAAIPLAWQFGPETFRVRAATLVNIEQDYNYDDYSGRRQTWMRAVRYFAEDPLTGLGPLNFPSRDGINTKANNIVAPWLNTHNTYVQVLSELGIFGIVAFMWLVARSLRLTKLAWRPPPRSDPGRLYRPEIFAALVAWAIAAMFLSHAYHYLTFYMFAIAALTGRVMAAERRQQTAPAPGIAGAPGRPAARGRLRGGLGHRFPGPR